jgi:RNA polymerase subunit RPABC4/transcription elongation factor Spt4
VECIIGPLIWIVCIALSVAISQEKGRSSAEGLLLGLLLGPVGVVISAVLPKNEAALEVRALSSGAMRKCPYCAELVKSQATVCRYCGRDIPIAPLDKVLYTHDGLVAYKCRNCGKAYDLAQLKLCPYCQWSEPSRQSILDAYRKQRASSAS